MSVQGAIGSISDLLAQWGTVQAAGEDRFTLAVDAAHLPGAVQALSAARWGYLSAITGLDHTAVAPQPEFEVLYHFCRGASVLTLKVKASGEHPTVPSISGIMPSAILQERELAELFGMHITDIPAKGRLLLSEDWPENLFPMRKKNAPAAIRERIAAPPLSARRRRIPRAAGQVRGSHRAAAPGIERAGAFRA